MITTVTTLISRRGHEQRVAKTFEQALRADADAGHHLASLLIQQDGGLNFLVSQFEDWHALEAWRASPEHRAMIEAFEVHSLRDLCTIENPVVRVMVPSAASGAKWKMLLASWGVTFPLILFVVELLAFLLPTFSFVARIALTSIILSVLVTWFLSPFVIRATRTWRLKDQQVRIVVLGSGSPRRPGPSSPDHGAPR